MSNNTDLQQMIDAAQEDYNNMKAAYDDAVRINNDACAAAESAQNDYHAQMDKLDSLKSQAGQARADGDTDLADQLDAQIDNETRIFDQLADVAQEKHTAAQAAAEAVYLPEENYQAAKKNLETLQTKQQNGDDSTSGNSSNNNGNGDNNGSGNSTNSSGINPGDRVQIKVGGLDITNGVTANTGQPYVEGGSTWAIVKSVDTNWYTGCEFNLDEIVTNVTCTSQDGTVVWQVRPEDIASNIIRAAEPTQTKPPEPSLNVENTEAGLASLNQPDRSQSIISSTASLTSYVTKKDSQTWTSGISTKAVSTGTIKPTTSLKIQEISGTHIADTSIFNC